MSPEPRWQADGVRAWAAQDLDAETPAAALAAFLAQARVGRDYIALNAFLPRNAETIAVLADWQAALGAHTGCAVTAGFGPRFLHSTGQLHKGGPNNGLFVVLTADPQQDFEIPGEGLTFGTLLLGQALGDLSALQAQGRRVLWLHADGLEHLIGVLKP